MLPQAAIETQGVEMVKALLKSLAKRFGYEIVGPPRAFATRRSLIGLIRQEQINLVLDVGANTGQFGSDLRAAGYTGRIISFEPLESAHTLLRMHAQRDRNWTIADRTAIGAETGSVDIHISGNSVSSSILGMLPSHANAEPESGYIGTETVSVNRLDDLTALSPSDRVLLKIDVQGFEMQVLEGARSVLKCCRAVISEMSLVPLYKGQVLARQMWDLLEAQDLEPWSLEPCYRHPKTGRMLQFDGVFVRGGGEVGSGSTIHDEQ
jgi:FkbM family methyltransferase